MLNGRFIFTMLILSLVLASCNKDGPIDDCALHSDKLSVHMQSYLSDHISYSTFAFAGNHDDFMAENGRYPVQILAVIPSEATNIRYYESDSLGNRDSLETYKEKEVEPLTSAEGLFTIFPRNQPRRDRYCRITYEHGDTLFLSPAIAIRARTLKSTYLDPITTDSAANGYFTFSWSSVPATDLYVFLLTDYTGSAIAGLTTRRNNLQFYDLRFAVRNFFPELNRPELVVGVGYTCTVYSISQRGWLNAMGKHTFKLEQ